MKINYHIAVILTYIFLPLIGYVTYNFLGFGPELLSILVVFVILYKNNVLNHFILIPRYIYAYGLFIIIVFISKYIISNQNISFDANFRNYLILFSIFISMTLFENMQLSKNNMHKIVQYIKILIGISLIVSLIQFFNSDFFISDRLIEIDEYSDIDYEERRILSIYSWVSNINLMVFSLPILLNIILGWEYITNNKKIESYWVIAAVGIICLLSQSRNFLLLYFIVVGYYIFKTFSLKNFILIFTGLVFVFLTMILIQFDVENYLTQRLLSETYITRIDAFYAFMSTFPSNPLWGTGGVVTDELINYYGRQTRLHNGYLAIFYYYGLIGGIVYLFHLVSMYYRSSNNYAKYNISIPKVTFICLAVGNLFVDYYTLFDIGLFMTIAFSSNIQNINQNIAD